MGRDVGVLLTGVATGIGVTVLAGWILHAVPTAPSAWAVVSGAWLSGADYVEGARLPMVGAALLLSLLLVVGGIAMRVLLMGPGIPDGVVLMGIGMFFLALGLWKAGGGVHALAVPLVLLGFVVMVWGVLQALRARRIRAQLW